MRILVMTDSPFIPSGQARVGREIAIGLAAKGHIVGYIGWWHPQHVFPNLPHNIQYWWTNNKLFGSDILDSVVQQFSPEILLTIGDLWNLDYITNPNYCRTRKYFQWCTYIPVDGETKRGGIPPSLIPVLEEVDIPVAYTDYAKEAVLKSTADQETRMRIRTIYHGVDVNLFKPLDPQERRKLRESMGVADKFIFLTVCRNQSRKNIPELFEAWAAFRSLPQAEGNVILWPHMWFKDGMGWDIDDLIRILGLRDSSIMFYNKIAHASNEHALLPEQDLVKLYQIADAFVLLSNEGFGLPTFEAMATKLPCILLDYAASAEIGADGRAVLIRPSGSVTWTGLHLTEKPVPDVDKTVSAMMKVYSDKKFRDETAKAGYEYVKKHTWAAAVAQWDMLFLEHEIPFIREKELEVVI